MKKLLIILALIVSSSAMAEMLELSFKDGMANEKTVMMEEILKDDLLKLHSRMVFAGERMIAGEFESKTKSPKKSFSDSLRDRLSGCKGFTRL